MCCCACCEEVTVGGRVVTEGGWEVPRGRSWKAASNPSRSRGRSRSAGVITPEVRPLCGVVYPAGGECVQVSYM